MLNKKLANILLVVGCMSFLFYLPYVGYYGDDYFNYLDAYERAITLPGYPWVASETFIDAEPFYLWYTAMVSIYSGQEFPFFMALNFGLCLLISYFILKNFNSYYKSFFWVMFLPVLFPTIFYYLLRSSLSFFMVALGFFTLLYFKDKKKSLLLALLFIFAGINLHSQYILASLLFLGGFIILKFNSVNNYTYNLKFVIVSSVILVGVLYSLKSLVEQLSTLLSFLPSSDIASNKIGYLTAEDDRSFRITSILSVLVYPFMAYQVLKKIYRSDTAFILKDKLKERKFIFLLFMIICYGGAINVAYIDSPHVASRLARFSDYLGMCLLLPMYFKVCVGNKLDYFILVFITVSVPILYPAVYIFVEWNIF